MFISTSSSSARIALVYITLGFLLVIWTAVWYIYLRNHTPATEVPYYFCCGLAVTGLTLIGIGLTVGKIGRASRAAERPINTIVAPPPVAAAPAPTTAVVQPTPISSPSPAAGAYKPQHIMLP